MSHMATKGRMRSDWDCSKGQFSYKTGHLNYVWLRIRVDWRRGGISVATASEEHLRAGKRWPGDVGSCFMAGTWIRRAGAAPALESVAHLH